MQACEFITVVIRRFIRENECSNREKIFFFFFWKNILFEKMNTKKNGLLSTYLSLFIFFFLFHLFSLRFSPTFTWIPMTWVTFFVICVCIDKRLISEFHPQSYWIYQSYMKNIIKLLIYQLRIIRESTCIFSCQL